MERTASKVPKFFNEIEPGFGTGDLKIPLKISRRMLNEFSETATLELKDYPKCQWTVQVSQIEGDVYLKDGWQKFIKDNSLGVILVLRYERAMHFTIEVFPKAAIVSDPSQEKSTWADNTLRPRLTPRNCNHQAAGENIPNCQSTQLKEVKEKEVEEQAATFPNSEFPSFSIFIRTQRYRATVPKDFSSEYLPPGDCYMVLKNSKGENWKVKVICNSSSSSYFCEGWIKFRRANQINCGDLCTFKLLDKKTFVVHVIPKRCIEKHQLETMTPRAIDNDVEEEPITFCTLLSPGISNEILEIPQKFQMHILNELSKLGELGELALLKMKDSLNCAWNIRVHQNATTVFLKEGWREFLEDHCIGDGELLIVRYDGRMQFRIQIFDKNRVERVDCPDTETFDANQNIAHNSELNGGEEYCQHYRTPKTSKCIKSKIPTVAITIENDMNHLEFPTEWCRKYLPTNCYKFELRNAEDIEGGKWKVKGGPNSEVSLCKGWIAFLQCNRVKKGDVCLLELNRKHQMVVNIIRK